MEVLGSEGLPLGGLTERPLLLEERAVLVINSDRENIWLRLCMYRWFEDVTLREGGVEKAKSSIMYPSLGEGVVA